MDTLSLSLAKVGLEDNEYVKDTDTQNLRREVIEVEDGEVLKFLDSVDGYLDLLESLSSVLRQGWMELASARHSMGSSRISSALFDLKLHPASTTLLVDQSINGFESDEGQSPREQQHFILSKWASSRGRNFLSEEEELGEVLDNKSHTQLRRRGPAQSSGLQEHNSVTDESTFTVDEQAQQERSKMLSVFGTLVSPKLRATQVSFETALETLIKIANVRSSMLSSFVRLKKEMGLEDRL